MDDPDFICLHKIQLKCMMGFGVPLNTLGGNDGFLEYPGRINFLIPAHGKDLTTTGCPKVRVTS